MTWIYEAANYLVDEALPAIGGFLSKNALPLAIGGGAYLGYTLQTMNVAV